MVATYSQVIAAADARGFDGLAASTDAELASLVRPIGLPQARIDCARSLAELLQSWEKEGVDPTAESADLDALVLDFATRVRGAPYKVAQCALLTARGYHCGIIPVDSGMVTKLAPVLGITLPSGAVAHERMRHLLEAVVHARPAEFRSLVTANEHQVTIPDGVEPTWWVHLVLIYFKPIRAATRAPAIQFGRSHQVCRGREPGRRGSPVAGKGSGPETTPVVSGPDRHRRGPCGHGLSCRGEQVPARRDAVTPATAGNMRRTVRNPSLQLDHPRHCGVYPANAGAYSDLCWW